MKQAKTRWGSMGLVLFVAALTVGCLRPDYTETQDRDEKLLELAGAEAEKIPSLEKRLKQQFLLADVSFDHDHDDTGIAALEKATVLLRRTDKSLNTITRLDGWLTVSELARRPENQALAEEAMTHVRSVLNSIKPSYHRLEFAQSVAREIQEVHGEPAAISFYRETLPWLEAAMEREDAMKKKDHAWTGIPYLASAKFRRGCDTKTWKPRTVVYAIARTLFYFDDFDTGKAALNLVDDPNWRSTSLVNMTRRNSKFTTPFGSSLGWQAYYLHE
jgi:hypothetical protein